MGILCAHVRIIYSKYFKIPSCIFVYLSSVHPQYQKFNNKRRYEILVLSTASIVPGTFCGRKEKNRRTSCASANKYRVKNYSHLEQNCIPLFSAFLFHYSLLDALACHRHTASYGLKFYYSSQGDHTSTVS